MGKFTKWACKQDRRGLDQMCLSSPAFKSCCFHRPSSKRKRLERNDPAALDRCWMAPGASSDTIEAMAARPRPDPTVIYRRLGTPDEHGNSDAVTHRRRRRNDMRGSTHAPHAKQRVHAPLLPRRAFEKRPKLQGKSRHYLKSVHMTFGAFARFSAPVGVAEGAARFSWALPDVAAAVSCAFAPPPARRQAPALPRRRCPT